MIAAVTATVTVTVMESLALIRPVGPEISGYCKASATGRISRAK